MAKGGEKLLLFLVHGHMPVPKKERLGFKVIHEATTFVTAQSVA